MPALTTLRLWSASFWRSAALCWAVTVATQWPSLTAFFHADDWQFFLTVAQDGPVHFVLAPFNNHFAPVSKAVICGLIEALGVRPVPFYAFGLALHLAIAALVLRLFRLVAREPLHALVATAWWAALPVHQHTLRSTSSIGVQVTTVVALVMFTSAIRAARAPAPGDATLLLRWGLLQALQAATSAMGLAIAAGFPLVLFVLLPRDRRPPRMLAALLPVSVVLLAAYVALQTMALEPSHPKLGVAALSTLWLIAYGAATVLLGPFALLRQGEFVIPPFGALPHDAALGLLTLIGLGVVALGGALSRRAPPRVAREAAGAAALAAGIYGAVAIGRSELIAGLPLRGGVANLTIGHYQYIGTALLVMVGLLAVTNAREGLVSRALASRPMIAATAALFALDLWASSNAGFALNEVDRKGFATARGRLEATLHASPPGLVYVANQPFDPMSMAYGLIGAADLGRVQYPGMAAVFAFLYESDTVNGRTMRFVDADDVVRYWRARGGRLGTLLVTQAEATSRL